MVVRVTATARGRRGVIRMMSRRHARTVLPPLFALVLVALVTRPIDEPVVRPAATPVDYTLAAALGPAGAVGVTVPVVAFTERVSVVAGHVRTPVLVNASAPAGTASIAGVPGCTVTARPGVVAWLDCAYPERDGELTVRVELASVIVYTHTVDPDRS
jgi:hypothetical protein